MDDNRIQREFPFITDGLYLDTMTRGLQPEGSLTKQYELLKSFPASADRSIHRLSLDAADQIDLLRAEIATFFHVSAKSIATHSSEPEALYTALWNICAPGVTIWLDPLADNMTRANCYHFAELRSCKILVRSDNLDITSRDVVIIPFRNQITADQVNTELLTVLKEKQCNVILLASMASPKELVELHELPFSIGIFDTTRTLLGPEGVVLSIWNTNTQEPFLVHSTIVHSDDEKPKILQGAQHMHSQTVHPAKLGGLAYSLKMLSSMGLDNLEEHSQKLMDILYTELDKLPQVKLVSADRHAMFLTFAVENVFAHDIALILSEVHNIHLRSGQLCSPHALNAAKLPEQLLQISVHWYVHEEDISRCVNTIQDLL